jgi:RNA polymerase sigma-70 factor, ECF subfamily
MTCPSGSNRRPVQLSGNLRLERYQESALNRAESVTSILNNSNELNKRRDEQHVLAAQCGSSEAFDELQRTYSRRLYRTVYAITKIVEDALQDAFLQAYSSLCQFEGRATIYSWLTRIAINSALTTLRKRRRRSEVFFDPDEKPGEDSAHFDLKNAAPNPEEICDQRQQRIRLFDAIQNLEPSLRTPPLMDLIEESSIKQIARALGTSVPAVKSRLYRARLRLSVASSFKQRKPFLGIHPTHDAEGRSWHSRRKENNPLRCKRLSTHNHTNLIKEK